MELISDAIIQRIENNKLGYRTYPVIKILIYVQKLSRNKENWQKEFRQIIFGANEYLIDHDCKDFNKLTADAKEQWLRFNNLLIQPFINQTKKADQRTDIEEAKACYICFKSLQRAGYKMLRDGRLPPLKWEFNKE